ncbi:GerAB/ArcD/ProY family transporter [Bacillus taeanensis]|uniref:Spore gernimation protein KB n=1 Tax=Bacillus taeanensis TaxID=273032 RepID=A0A366XUX6_9BACI|nr:GerAB/ArcD/ProY family transporter [Bacillus taeanensis]RBW67943.1 spore gernimation protein KB [Bacillus taeanensis]
MQTAKISPFQLFTLIVFFEIGTTVMFPLGAGAKQAAWITILLGMAGGVPLLFMYHYLFQNYPNMPLTEYMKDIFGKFVGTFVGILYMLYFLYGAARDVRDGMELLTLYYMGTPISVLGFLLMAVILYGIYKGIEVLCRTSEAFFIYLIGTGVLFVILVMGSGIVHTDRLFPILEPDWKTIIGTAFKETWMAPFGEMICFTMIFHYLTNKKLQLQVSMSAVILSGLVLAFIHGLTITVLGANIRGEKISPLLEMNKLIDIGDFIQRLDSFFMVWLIVNDFFKISVFMYAAILAGSTIFHVSKKILILPFGAAVVITSIYFAPNYGAHMKQSFVVLQYVYPVFAAYIPFLLCIVLFIRKKVNKKR